MHQAKSTSTITDKSQPNLQSLEPNVTSLNAHGYGKIKAVLTRYDISRSAFNRLRDDDPEFPTWFKRGKLCIYDFAKLDKYFSA